MLKKINIKNLKPGMKLVKGLTFKGKKLFEAGTILNTQNILQIQKLANPNTYITVEISTGVVMNENGEVDSKATFTNIVMNLRNKNK